MLSQPILLALNAKSSEIAQQLSGFVSPPFSADEHLMVMTIAAGALNGAALTAEQLAYLPSTAQAAAFSNAYFAARALFSQRSAELDAIVADALVDQENGSLDEPAVIAAIGAV